MCGLCGWVGRPDPPLLKLMCHGLAHRGPDDEGLFADEQVSLGHRRLSIIDLDTGHQPMMSERGRTVIVHNGEVYNFQELRAELLKAGQEFVTRSDTEVILNAYEAWGTDCLKRFNGMFAFALYNRVDQKLFLAVDRFGKKPLYYAVRNGQFIFASGLKALLRHPVLDAELNLLALSKYFLYEYIPAPSTIYRNIYKLPAGHFLLVDLKEGCVTSALRPRPYWDLSFKPKLEITFEEAEEQLRQHLKSAVRRRLISDVPLGLFLSGGLDSSSILALMAEMVPARQIKTFSVGFRDPSYDETAFARQVAQHFGTDHREQILDARATLDILPEVVACSDEPFADNSIVPTYLLSRLARASVKVAVGGDGGDELFAGYDSFAAHRVFHLYEQLPAWVRRALRQLDGRLPASAHMLFDFKLRQFLKSEGMTLVDRHQRWLSACTPEEMTRLFTPDALREILGQDKEDHSPFAEGFDALSRSDAREDIDRLIHLYARLHLPNDIMVKVDRASMAHGLEVRAPFLDVEFVEFVNRLPTAYKMLRLSRKHLLRRAMKGRVPEAVLKRRKQGFALPVNDWLRGEWRELLQATLDPLRIRREGLFNVGYVRTLMTDHLSGRWGHRKLLWALFFFHLWQESREGHQRLAL
jgi:asparagine synthase (glutamine-hydrolysing)